MKNHASVFLILLLVSSQAFAMGKRPISPTLDLQQVQGMYQIVSPEKPDYWWGTDSTYFCGVRSKTIQVTSGEEAADSFLTISHQFYGEADAFRPVLVFEQPNQSEVTQSWNSEGKWGTRYNKTTLEGNLLVLHQKIFDRSYFIPSRSYAATVVRFEPEKDTLRICTSSREISNKYDQKEKWPRLHDCTEHTALSCLYKKIE